MGNSGQSHHTLRHLLCASVTLQTQRCDRVWELAPRSNSAGFPTRARLHRARYLVVQASVLQRVVCGLRHGLPQLRRHAPEVCLQRFGALLECVQHPACVRYTCGALLQKGRHISTAPDCRNTQYLDGRCANLRCGSTLNTTIQPVWQASAGAVVVTSASGSLVWQHASAPCALAGAAAQRACGRVAVA